MKEITVLVPNKIGVLAEVTDELGKNGVNIVSISAMGIGDVGVIRLITSDERSAMNILTKYIATKKERYEVKLADVIIVSIPDKAGELAKICKRLSKLGINIETVYLLKREAGIAELIIRPEKVDEALRELKAAGVKVRL
jgi:hypothetical protein